MSVESEFERVALPLSDAFTIARGTQETAENVVVRITDEDGTTGIGGAAPSAHYGETVETVTVVLPELLSVVEDIGDPHQLDLIERRMRETVSENPAAHTAVSIALHDLVAKRLEMPLYRYWGLNSDRSIETSFTIGLDEIDRMVEKTVDALEAGHDVLKVKLGTDHDAEIIEAVRDVASEATIRVDANEAWTPREAIRMIDMLANFDVEFVEQPVPATASEGLQFVFERAALPIAADESCVRLADIPLLTGRADIVNIKLMKCGGLREAMRMIHAARAHDLEVMLGCMIESNASIAAGAHLTPLLDYADLDGSMLLAEDRYDGVAMPDGRITLGAVNGNGTGVDPA